MVSLVCTKSLQATAYFMFLIGWMFITKYSIPLTLGILIVYELFYF